MNIKEIRELTDVELTSKLEELRREELTLAMKSSVGQLENSAQKRTVRRSIARILTEQNARQAK